MTLPEERTAHSLLVLSTIMAGCTSVAVPLDNSESAYWNPPALAEDEGELPDGRAVIQRMLEFMGSHDALAVEALLTYEAVQADGQKLHFDLLHQVAFRKNENKLLWRTLKDDGTFDVGWVANGMFTMIKQPANIYARIHGPVAVPEMVAMLTDEYGIDVPFEDLIGGQAAEHWLGQEVTSVSYVGEAFIGGRWTDQIAIRKPGLDLEIWVAKGDASYPARIAATFIEAEGAVSYILEFRKYSTTPLSRESVDLEIPEDARRVDLAPVVLHELTEQDLNVE